LRVARADMNDKIVISLNSKRYWFGVFFELSPDITTEVVVKIYDSFGHCDTQGSTIVRNIIQKTLAPLG
jgi:hypothetical protein